MEIDITKAIRMTQPRKPNKRDGCKDLLKNEIALEFKDFNATDKDILKDILKQIGKQLGKTLEIKRITVFVGIKEES